MYTLKIELRLKEGEQCGRVVLAYNSTRQSINPYLLQVRLRSNSKNDKTLRGGIVRNGSNTSPPSNFGSASTLPATPTVGTPLLAHNFQNSPRIHDSKVV